MSAIPLVKQLPPYKFTLRASTLQEMVMFGLAGAANAAAYLLVSALSLAYLTSSPIIATTLGYIAAVIVSFVCNATITFKDGRVTSATQAGKFAVLYGIGYAYNVLVIGIGAEMFGFPFLAMVALVTVTWPVCSFLVSKYLVFTPTN